MKKLVLAIVVLSVAVSSFADDARTVIGAGFKTCGAYTANTPASKESNNQWAMGYLVASAFERDVDFLASQDWGGIVGYLEKYCRENPLDKFMFAAYAAKVELIRRATAVGR